MFHYIQQRWTLSWYQLSLPVDFRHNGLAMRKTAWFYDVSVSLCSIISCAIIIIQNVGVTRHFILQEPGSLWCIWAIFHPTPCIIYWPWRPIRADSRLAPSRWETALLCNDVSHWLRAILESARLMMVPHNDIRHTVLRLSDWPSGETSLQIYPIYICVWIWLMIADY